MLGVFAPKIDRKVSVPQNHLDNDESLVSLESIKEKRLLLKRVVMITRATERMQDSLKSVLILGQPSTSIPKGMLKYYHILSNKIKRKTTDKIRWYLGKLEGLIKSNLQGIIKLTLEEHDFSSLIPPSEQDEEASVYDAVNLLNEFKRQSQTAVALKILLQQRGVYTPGTVVKASVEQIEGHIKRLEEKEEIQRSQIKKHITEMHSELSQMLNSDQYSDEMKKVFRKVIDNLETDQKAIDQGARVDDIQLSFEVVETGVEKKKDPKEEQQQVENETEEYLEEFDQNESPLKVSGKTGFFSTLFKWLNTPWSVSWEDVKKGKNE
jgi:hypothetical protein